MKEGGGMGYDGIEWCEGLSAIVMAVSSTKEGGVEDAFFLSC